MGGPFAVFGREDATSYWLVSRQVDQRVEDPIDLVERVVVAEADPDGAAGFQDVQPLEQLHRVVVPVPCEDPALRERLGRVSGMLIAQPYRERGGSLGQPVDAGNAVQPRLRDRRQTLQEAGGQRPFVLADRVERRGDLVGARGPACGGGVPTERRQVVDGSDEPGEPLVVLGAGLPAFGGGVVLGGPDAVGIPRRRGSRTWPPPCPGAVRTPCTARRSPCRRPGPGSRSNGVARSGRRRRRRGRPRTSHAPPDRRRGSRCPRRWTRA